MAIGTISLQSNWSRGTLLQAAGGIAFTSCGTAAVLLIRDRMDEQVARIFRPFWLGLPRLAWIVLVVGLFLALVDVVLAFIPSHP
jgi:hypothetical protein